MAGEGGEGSRSIEQTPTWAVAAVCLVFVLISILIEQAIHHIGHWLKKHHKKALYDALEKIKDELMLVGFISLLLTVGQKPISKICISKSLGDTMLPCKKKDDKTSKEDEKYDSSLLYCNKKGRVPLISYHGMHDLHIFIFVLAVFHVLYCVITMALGNAKMVRWKAWEQETKTMEYEYSHHPARFRFTRETTFGRRHMSFWTRTPILIWIVCFFRQFFRSVPKVDYLTLRHGFILAHLDRNSKFDFQKYIKRSLEDDFKVIVGISTPLWAFAVIFLLLNIHGWDTYFWLSFVPLAIILVVGTKLQVIITDMGLEIHQRHAVVKGTPVVHPSDNLFWFSRPHWVLYLIHFTLFQNAFQLAFFVWTWYKYGLRSCMHDRLEYIITRLAMGVGVQFLCSYVTLPLYALVSQMGSNMKRAIFEELTANALKKWHQNARKNLKRDRKSGLRSGQSTPTHGSTSPIHLLHRYKSAGDVENTQLSPGFYSDYEMYSDLETDASPSSSRPISPKQSSTVWNHMAEQNRSEATVKHSNKKENKTAGAPSDNQSAEQHNTKPDADENATDADFSFAI